MHCIAAAKHHTSKIREFEDLIDVNTFGFRGEALSSLCAVADMTVITRHADVEFGAKLEIDHFGRIKTRTVCPRSVGTTVVLRNIFANLPVRRREFQKHIKNEFNKMATILRAYGLVSAQCRIIATDQTGKGTKKTVLATTVSGSIRNNIVSVFGSREANQLVEIQQPMRDNETLTQDMLEGIDMSIQINDDDLDALGLSRFRFDGYISSCAHGCGRPARDRQYFYINSRPCEPKQLIKLVNDVYRMHNIHQSPFIVLNILMGNTEIDINVTPDKRQILVNQEKILMLALKKSLLKTFNRIPSTYKKQNQDLSITSPPPKLITDFIKPSVMDDSVHGDDADDADENDVSFDSPPRKARKPNPNSDFSQLLQRKLASETSSPGEKVRKSKMKSIADFLFKSKQFLGEMKEPKPASAVSEEDDSSRDSTDAPQQSRAKRERSCSPEGDGDSSPEISPIRAKPTKATTFRESPEPDYDSPMCNIKPSRADDNQINFEDIPSDSSPPRATERISAKRPKVEPQIISDKKDAVPGTANEPSAQVTTISTSVNQIRELLAHENLLKTQAIQKQSQFNGLQFKSKIDPSNNKLAEQELDTSICKTDFDKMEIIGQFNLGFIIVRLNDDLFIVDQHAADEKFNFETLEEKTELQSQMLAVAEPIILNPTSEAILLDHLHLFELNGFKFEIDDCDGRENLDGSITTSRVKVAAKPFSKNWSFGREDIEELIFMIQETEGRVNGVLRPSKVRSMFASRACRMSVMVGHSLSGASMKRVVSQMGTIKYPWVRQTVIHSTCLSFNINALNFCSLLAELPARSTHNKTSNQPRVD